MNTLKRASLILFWVFLGLIGTASPLTAQVADFAPAGQGGAAIPMTPHTGGNSLVNLQLGGGGTERQNVNTAIQIVFMMTLLTLAPSIVMLMTSFTRIVIVLGFVRTAVGVQGAPSNQIIIGISLFLTFFLMQPVVNEVHQNALKPYMAEQITTDEAMERATKPIRDFMLRQTRPNEIEFFLGLAGMPPTETSQLPLRVVIPSFVVSELRTSFQMGFLIFIPFLLVDFLVSSTLMAMGMMMMPPVVVSLPFKILLFVLVDGWHLVIRSLVESFGT